MLDVYQNLPGMIDPVAFSIGWFHVRWYSIMYIVGFLTVWLLISWRIKRAELDEELQATSYRLQETIFDFLIHIFIGGLIGGRFGYAIFYNPTFYFQNPASIVLPWSNGDWTGLFGMSFFGALIGGLVAAHYFCRRKRINFWTLSNLVVPAIPAGYFFGRIGNFLNLELYGRVTEKSWGMYFDGELRHPSQLYEAFFEGLVIFVVLWSLRNNRRWKNYLLFIFLMLYGLFRFAIEFFREEPVYRIGMTQGQLFSCLLIFISGAIFFWFRHWKNDIIAKSD